MIFRGRIVSAEWDSSLGPCVEIDNVDDVSAARKVLGWRVVVVSAEEYDASPIERAKVLLKKMTPEQRTEAFAGYCRACGSNLPCHCWNDE
jgi:hypothetical protein